MITYLHSDAPKEAAAQALSDALRQRGDESVLFLSSGGSSLALLDLVSMDVVGGDMTVSMLDERFTQVGEDQNFTVLSGSSFFTGAKARGVSFIDSRPRPDESIEVAAARCERSFRTWRASHPHGRIVITLGMGPDGHTAGIFPMPTHAERFAELFEESERWVAGYEIPEGENPHRFRITVTPLFLATEVADAVSFVVGADKAWVVKGLQNNVRPLHEFPAGILARVPSAILVTDVVV